MKTKIDWHYPRTEIAETILGLFESESTNAITIFAKRRMGKTEMLVNDLWPLAEMSGYDVRYMSFWLDKGSPEQVFFDTLSAKNQNYSSIKARVGIFGSYIETTKNLLYSGKSKPTLQLISSTLEKSGRRKKKTLLLLDEIQELAVGDKDDHFVAMLRTVLDAHKKKIHVVFTGSSQEGLLKMFRKHKAPLFNFSHQLDLPELTPSFVIYMIDAFHKASGKKLNLAASLRVFTKSHKVPARFHDLLRTMLISGRNDIEQAFNEYKESSGEQLKFASDWQKLNPLDQMILQRIAVGKGNLFSEDGRNDLSTLLGVEMVSKSSVQKSLKRLKSADIVETFNRGQYDFVEMVFRDYVLEQSSI